LLEVFVRLVIWDGKRLSLHRLEEREVFVEGLFSEEVVNERLEDLVIEIIVNLTTKD